MVISRRINALPLKERTSQPSLLSEWIPEIVMDIEDVLEGLSYYIKKNGTKRKIPNALKKGLTLYDAMKILHPKIDASGDNFK